MTRRSTALYVPDVRSIAAASIVLLATALVACTGNRLHRFPHQSIAMVSPLRGGPLPSPTVSTPAPQHPDYRVTSETLFDDAKLTMLDARQVCADVTLRTLADPTPIDQYQAYLRASDHVHTDGHVAPTSAATTSIQGESYEVTGHTSPCVDHHGHTCVRRSEHTQGRFTEATLELLTQSGTVCFPNDGFVTASTETIELYLVAPGDELGVGFEWELVGAP